MAQDIASLTTHDDILAALRTCEASESAVDAQLDALLADAQTLSRLLQQIEALAPSVASVEREARDLALRIDNTAQVAQRISSQVRVLDDEQSKVKASIETLQAVQDLKVRLTAGASAAFPQHADVTSTKLTLTRTPLLFAL